MSDIYAEFMGLLAPPAQPAGGWLFGDVEDAGQGRLRVTCGGLSLSEGELHVPPELDYGWTADDGGEDLLRAGDRLLVLVTADRQEYYILKKAVFS